MGSAADDDDRSWVERLRDLRRMHAWSQRRLARELRVTPGAVSMWESGQRAIPGPVRRLVELYERELAMIDPPAEKGVERINATWSSRTLRTTRSTARIAGKLAGSSLRSLVAGNVRAAEIKAATELAIADEVVATLGQLKGLPMKLGQLVSYLGFVAPDQVQAVLASLQDDVEPLSEGAVRLVFLESLGAPPERLFARWDPLPFAAASIGQVHRAALADGSEVAVKVQYPGVRAAIESDLKGLGALGRMGSLVFRGQQPDALLEELSARLLEECDYRLEASNQEEFFRLYDGDEEIVVPRVHRELSTDRVLTTQLLRGRSFAAFVEEADQRRKDRAGRIIFRMALGSTFQHGIFNADPHPGNYLFLDDGRVGFLDFGCVKRFPPDFLERWRLYTRAVVEGRREDSDRLAVKLGIVDDPERFDFDYQYAMMQRIHEGWLTQAPFRFNRHFVAATWRALVIDNPNKSRIRIPTDALFANRLQWGMHSVLAELGAQGRWRPLFDACTAGKAGRTPRRRRTRRS